MPAILLAVLAYVAGLLGGFAELARPLLLTSAVALLLGGARRTASAVAVALLAAAGVGAAVLSGRAARTCAERLATRAEWLLVLNEDARPGRRARGAIVDGGCRMDATLAVAAGAGDAGAFVRARGAARPAGRGLLVREALVVSTGGSHPLRRWRAEAANRLDAVFGADAPLARALLVADTRAIPADLRDRFAAAGLVHLLSISGLHVAILASALELLFGAARVPRAATRVAACATAALYVAMLGFPPPAVRALGMLAVTTAARLAQRPTSPWAALAIASALPLALRVDVVLDLGYQLSVTGMAALIAGGTLARRVFRPRLTGAGLAVARELATSTVATLATAPLVAWWFGQVSLVGPLANLVAAPVVGLLQPTLFLALAAAPVAPEAARFVAGAAHPLLVALDVIARAASGLPQAVARVAPSLLTATVAALAAAALLVACASARPARALTVALTAAAALAWLPGELVLGSGTVELHMLDVGQGDALALRTPRGRWVLFDAGPAWGAGDAGRRVIIPYLRRRGGGVAAFVLSHPHLDHVGGASSVIGALRPGEYWDAGFPGGGDAYRASLASAGADAVPWRRARAGDSLVVDDVRIRFLAPDSAWAASLPDANDASAVALVDFRGVRFLLVGDAERAEEEWLLANARDDLQADVLKVGHHGSRTSSTPAFLAAVRPRVALVSVGLGNEYGHPSPDVMGRLAAAGADVLRSDLLGSVVVRTDGHHLTVIADDLEWPVSSAVPERASRRRW